MAEFESQWSQWSGLQHSLFVNSGSSANLLAYAALRESRRLRNSKVVVPAVSWSTTVAPAFQLGFEPFACEADGADFGLDLDHLEYLLRTHEPATVVLVHVLGVPNQMDKVLALRERYEFILIEDTCAAMGSRFDDRLVGTFGDVSTFSLYYGHHISTIEGGLVCTNHEDLFEILQHLRSHGWPKDLQPEREAQKAREHGISDFNRQFTFYHPGFNVRSTDLNARLGLSQLRKLDSVVQRRIANHHLYQARFQGASGFSCQGNDRATICSIAFGLLTASADHRDRLAAALRREGVETRPIGGGNMSRQPFWRERYGPVSLPMADRIHMTGLQLPNNPTLTADDVNAITDIVLTAVDSVSFAEGIVV